jgi:LuxR family maltose regulon positive regulatory protein
MLRGVTVETASALVLLEPPTIAPDLARPSGLVPRTRLVRRLTGSEAPLVFVVAPAGYGKTTLLAEWDTRDERPFVWTTLDAAEACLESGGAQVIVVDDLPADTSSDVMQRVLNLAARLPRGTVLAIASRTRPACALGRPRARRLLLELNAADLALSPLEAAMLVDAVGLRLDRHRLVRLLERTQGWPAMVYLAAATVLAAEDTDAAITRFGGTDRAVAEFLQDEVLGALSDEDRVFLRRSSVLPCLSAGACDAVLGRTDSWTTLVRLTRAGVPIVPLDRTDLGYRANPLLTELLRAELAVREPHGERALHRRAALWFAREREPGLAVRQATDGRDARLAGRIAWAHAPHAAAAGRGERIGEWLAAVGGASDDPGLALTAAVHDVLTGRGGLACAAVDAADRLLERHPLGGGAAGVALLRAYLAPSGVEQMALDAARARTVLPAADPWHALALLLLGVAHLFEGDRDAAGAELAQALTRASGRLPLVAGAAQVQLALLAADREDWDDAAQRAGEARATLPPGAPNALSALSAATVAVATAHRGEITQARAAAAEAAARLATRGEFPAWLVCEAEVWLARAAIRLSDGPTARRLLARAARLAPSVGPQATATRWIHDGWARADAFAECATGDGPTLTNAELRILRLLPSHLSFREIGKRLHVSPNTVKTQALAVYRKLDVSCRSDAVERGRSAGLIGE